MSPNLKVLVADDNRDHVQLITEILNQELKAEVEGVTKGEECLKKVKKTRYDLLLLDYLFPEISGLDILKEIVEKDYDLPVIMITGHGSEKVAVEAMKAGAIDYIVKSEDGFQSLPFVAKKAIEKDQLRKRLRQSEEKFQNLFESANDAIIYLDRAGRILEVNKQAVEVFGGSKEEVLGKHFTKVGIFTPRDIPTLMSNFANILAGKEVTVNVCFKNKKDQEIALECSTSLMKTDDKVTGVMVIARDITERKRAEEALHETTQTLEAVIQASPLPIFAVDRERIVKTWNPAAERTFGWGAQEVIGRQYPAIPKKKMDEADALFLRALESGLTEVETLRQRKDGSLIDVSISAAPLRDSRGNINGVMAVIADITERKQAEKALRESEERFSKAFHASPDPMTLSRLSDGLLLEVNDSWEQVLGYSRAESVGTSSVTLGLWHDPAVRQKCLQQLRETGSLRDFETELRRKTGEVRQVILSSEALEIGSEQCLLTLIRDITERKRAEEALQASEQRYRGLFEDSPISLWEEDFSDIKTHIDSRRTKGVRDFRTYFQNHPEVVAHCAAQVKVVDVNKASLELFKARSKEELQRGLDKTFRQKSYGAFSEELISLADGKTVFETETLTQTLTGDKKNIALRWTVAPGYEQTYSKVLVSITDITERKRAEEALKKSVQLLRDTGEMAQVGGWELDLSTKEVSWTDEVGRIHGVEPGYKLKLEEAVNFYAPESIPALRATLKKTIETGEPYDLESLFIPRGSKNKIWVRSLGRAIYSGDKIVKLAGTFQNIDKYKRAEEALKESEEKFRTLAESAQCGITILQGEKAIYNNPAVASYTDYTEEELKQMNFWDMVRPDFKDLVKGRGLSRQEGKPVPAHYEIPIITKNAEERWIDISAGTCELSGKPSVISIAFDITERKRAEEALKESEERYKFLYEESQAINIIIGMDGKIMDLNKTAVELLGYDKKDVIGKDAIEFVALEQRETIAKQLAQELKGEQTPQVYVDVIGKEVIRTLLFAEGHGTIFEKGRPVGILLSAIDITEQKKMEAQLIQSERLAAVGTLSYGIAHEFNNILAGMLGNAEFGMESSDPEETKECFRIIMEGCDRAKSITNSLLAFSRQRETKRQRADVTQAVETVLGLVDRELEKQNINVVRKFSPIPEITCDLGELSGVVLNMMTNARDAMTPKGGTLTIEIHEKKDNIEMIFIDTGCGIPDSIKGRIFEPFVTTKGALGQSEIPGTGLGLFLSYGIINRYHGEIKVKSEVGKGSTFTIKIPISKNQELPVPLEPEKKESIFVPQNLNILLVDDEEPICTAVKKFFEAKGHSVTIALSGKKGVNIFKRGGFDLVLADLTMPDMDGVELISKLKEIDQQVKFIVLTGHRSEEKLESAKKAGADQILMKPFRNEELYQAIGRVLSVEAKF